MSTLFWALSESPHHSNTRFSRSKNHSSCLPSRNCWFYYVVHLSDPGKWDSKYGVTSPRSVLLGCLRTGGGDRSSDAPKSQFAPKWAGTGTFRFRWTGEEILKMAKWSGGRCMNLTLRPCPLKRASLITKGQKWPWPFPEPPTNFSSARIKPSSILQGPSVQLKDREEYSPFTVPIANLPTCHG